MSYLLTVTLLWSFSFSLIGVYLSGQVDPYVSVLSRILLAFLVFLPFMKMKKVSKQVISGLMLIGGVQLGMMYLFYYHSFLFLTVPEVLLFTVFTPVYVIILYDLFNKRFSLNYMISALLAVAGAAIIKYSAINPNFWIGFFIVQASNLCFAAGQVGYKILQEKQTIELNHYQLFGWFYLGALIICSIASFLFADFSQTPTTYKQWIILLWLGIVASGFGFYLWNKGACKVSAGLLAVMNNALVPAGLLVNLLIWNQQADLKRLAIGGGLILLALWFCQPSTCIQPNTNS